MSRQNYKTSCTFMADVELVEQIDQLAFERWQTRSQMLREIIGSYMASRSEAEKNSEIIISKLMNQATTGS